jgi:NTP pyrophosphatase (non-canonical NTP hydrolase)
MHKMKFDDYQKQATLLNVSGDSPLKNEILVLGVVGEAGEVADKWKKVLAYHNGEFTDEDIAEIGKELGDVIWYVAALAESLGISFGNIAQQNLEKLHSRHTRGVVRGAGDNR